MSSHGNGEDSAMMRVISRAKKMTEIIWDDGTAEIKIRKKKIVFSF